MKRSISQYQYHQTGWDNVCGMDLLGNECCGFCLDFRHGVDAFFSHPFEFGLRGGFAIVILEES